MELKFFADFKIVRYSIIYIKAMSPRLTWNHDGLFAVMLWQSLK